MAVKLRLMRMGKKKQPTYRVVAADSRAPRNGRFIEIIGIYEPRQDPSVVRIDNERALHWLRHGAQPTERVEKLLTNALDSPDHPPVGVTPNWGRREASVLLIRFLLDEDRLGEARALVDRALVRWPGSWEHRVFLANLIGEGR